MYSKQEASQLRQQFWTALGQYLSPIESAEGLSINWINYKTGIKGIHFKMNADNTTASICIEMTDKDAGVQALYFEQFRQSQAMLHEAVGEAWKKQLHTTDEWGHTISRIYTELQNISIYQREDWPRLISFFKPRIIALDAFWSNAKYLFETLQ